MSEELKRIFFFVAVMGIFFFGVGYAINTSSGYGDTKKQLAELRATISKSRQLVGEDVASRDRQKQYNTDAKSGLISIEARYTESDKQLGQIELRISDSRGYIEELKDTIRQLRQEIERHRDCFQ